MMPSTKSSSKPKPPAKSFTFEAIGTQWLIRLWSDSADFAKLQERIKQRIEVFDKTYSRFRQDSLITKMSQNAGTYEMPYDAEKLISFYRQMYDATDGLVTPLIGQALSDAGYDAEYSLQKKPMTELPAWDSVLTYQQGKLTTTHPVLLDFGAAGKGYLVDIVAELCDKSGIEEYLISAGGDLVYRTPNVGKPARIGLENPDDMNQIIGVAYIANQSLCGSATNRRTWGDFHHILNPRSLSSPQHIKAVWVVADSTMLADGIATCLYFISPDELQPAFAFEYLIVGLDNTAMHSKNFPAELFTS